MKKSGSFIKFYRNQQILIFIFWFYGFRTHYVSLEDGKVFKLGKSSIEVKDVTKMVHIEEITPNVIEPSFGIGRIMYAVLEHNFRKRGENSNSYLALPALVAPHKCSILPLMNKTDFLPFTDRICK